MTPQEFKAWFDGFTENVDKQPTQKQWARIKERVAEIDGKAVTERVYVDRYVPLPYRKRYWDDYVTWGDASYTTTCSSTQASLSASPPRTLLCGDNRFDSLTAMCALGKADAAAL